jgi:hypothetical protein
MGEIGTQVPAERQTGGTEEVSSLVVVDEKRRLAEPLDCWVTREPPSVLAQERTG